MARENWALIDGFAVSRAMPPLSSLPQDRFDNFIYYWATRNAGHEQVEDFNRKLWMPPRGEVVTHAESPWSPENETSAFQAFKAQVNA